MKINLLSVILAAIIAILLFFSGFFIGKTKNPLNHEKVISTLTDSIQSAVYKEFALLRSATTERVDTVYKWGYRTIKEVEYVEVSAPQELEDQGLKQFVSHDKSDILTIIDTITSTGYIIGHTRDILLDTPYVYVVTTLRDTVVLDNVKTVEKKVQSPALFVGTSIDHVNIGTLDNIYSPRVGMSISLGYMDKKRQMFSLSKSLTDTYGFSIAYGYKLW
jgi:hypothetical protein